MQSHPSGKNKDAARVGHPKFHPSRVGNIGGELRRSEGWGTRMMN
jgi:hypothetical protein